MDWIRRRPDAAAALALFLLPLVMLAGALLPGRVLSPADSLLTAYPWDSVVPGVAPANPLLIDVTFVLHPFLIHAGREVGHGHFPLWNPFMFSGVPFFANSKSALLFPLTWLAYLLPTAAALSLVSILKFSAAGLAMYWCLRVLAVGPFAAFVGALGFMFNGALVVWLQFPLGSTMIFIPLLLGATERLRDRPGGRWVAGLALAAALAVFAGNPQGTFQAMAAATAWALCRARGAAAGAPRFLARYAAGAGLGVVLSAVQLLPFLEYMRESAIFANRAEWTPVLHMPFRSAISFLMPYYYGSPTGGDFWGPWNFAEITASVGLVPLVALPAALLGLWRRPGAAFFAGMAAVAAGLLYGAPLLAGALAALPMASLLVNLRLTPILAFALCALGALGLEAVSQAGPEAGRRLARAVRAGFVALAALAFLVVMDDWSAIPHDAMRVPVLAQSLWALLLLTLAALLVLGRLRAAGAGAGPSLALVLVQLASLAPLALTFNPVMPSGWLYPTPPAIRHLQGESARDQGRVLLYPNVPMLYGLSEVSGYDGMTPRRLSRLVRTGGAFDMLGNGSLNAQMVFRSPVVDLLGIRHVLVGADGSLPAPAFSLEYEGRDARVYRNERALPRAFLVPRGRCVDDDTAVRLIWQRAVDFREEVLLGDCAAAPAAGPRDGASRAEIRHYSAERVVIGVTSEAPAYLVLTDTWYPGWRASVDGTAQALWRANHAFRAVWLSPGRHEVEFRFRPVSFQVGLALSALAALVTGGLLRVSRRRSGTGR